MLYSKHLIARQANVHSCQTGGRLPYSRSVKIITYHVPATAVRCFDAGVHVGDWVLTNDISSMRRKQLSFKPTCLAFRA